MKTPPTRAAELKPKAAAAPVAWGDEGVVVRVAWGTPWVAVWVRVVGEPGAPDLVAVIDELLGMVVVLLVLTRVVAAAVGAALEAEVMVDGAAELVLLVTGLSVTGLMVKGFDHWKTVGSEARTILRPYAFLSPSEASTFQM